ncbi:hypothetical protein ACWEIJ_13970 [Lentzea sp. NPDC004789]
MTSKTADNTTSPVRAVVDRWPMALALAVSFDFWETPLVPPVWTLLLCQVAYLLWGWRAPRVQIAMLSAYTALAALVIIATPHAPRAGVLLIALGWGAHAAWDLVHHLRDAVVPRWFSEFCGVFDLVIAVTILLKWF